MTKLEGAKSLNIRNGRDKPLTLYMEPWGTPHQMQPGTSYRIILEGVPHEDGPTIELHTDGSVSVSPECGFKLLHDAQVLEQQ